MGASLLVGWAHLAGAGAPLIAVVLAGLGTGLVVLGRRPLPESVRPELPALVQGDRVLLFGSPLVTLDERLAKAAEQAGISSLVPKP